MCSSSEVYYSLVKKRGQLRLPAGVSPPFSLYSTNMLALILCNKTYIYVCNNFTDI